MNTSIAARHAARTRKPSFWERSADLMKSFGFPAVLAILSFSLGLASDGFKDRSAADHATKETRSKTLVATAAAFSGYLVNWSRLRTIAEAESEIQSRVATARAKLRPKAKNDVPTEISRLESTLLVVRTRKEKYVAGRDASKDELLRQLETAKIFFSNALPPTIDAFERFDRASSVLELKELPPLDLWRKEFSPILKIMQEEVKRDES